MYFAPTFLEELTRPLSDPAIFASDAQQFTFDGKVVSFCNSSLRSGMEAALRKSGLIFDRY